MTAKTKSRTILRLSTLAKTYLIEQATYYQYIRTPRNPATLPYATMQQYLNTLARCKFQDTRPQDIMDLDTELTQQNLPLIWYNDGPGPGNRDNQPELRKWQWHLSIPHTTQNHFIAIAEHYRITPMYYKYRPPHNQIPNQITRVAAVLEAIGQQNLTPLDLPIATHKYPVRYDPSYPSRSWPSIAIYPAGGAPR